MSTLEKAIAIAVEAHKGQLDKAGKPLILHPLRVMFRMEDEVNMMAAVLHDAAEDGYLTLEELRQAGFAEAIIEAIDCLTRRDNESYDNFIGRISQNRLARTVKCADLEDNMNVLRLKQLSEDDIKRLQKYHQAWNKLQEMQAPKK